MDSKPPSGDTRRRLLRAASELFAERGFHGTKVRDIAERARVNLASGHYHFGSKKALYFEVLRTHFAEIRSLLEKRGVQPSPADLERATREDLERLLEGRVRVMLEVLIGPPPDLHGALMMREMIDPSEALPVIVAEFIRPMQGEMEQILRRLDPDLDRSGLERSIFGIVGQVLYFRFAMPIVLELLGRSEYSRAFSAEMAAHIAAFSLGGMQRIASRAAKPDRSRRRAL